MVNNQSPRHDGHLDAVFHALSDPTRRAMLTRLASGQRTVGELADPFAISLAAASKHIKVLENAGLLQREVRGRTHVCRIDALPMQAGVEWMRHYERFWQQSLDTLEALLKAEDAASARPSASKKTSAKQPRRVPPKP